MPIKRVKDHPPIVLSSEDRIIFWFDKDRTIKRFGITYQALLERKWLNIVRYDNTHDSRSLPHVHKFYTKKKLVIVLPGIPSEVYTSATNELKKHFRKFRNYYIINHNK